jgi:hypothetical protein
MRRTKSTIKGERIINLPEKRVSRFAVQWEADERENYNAIEANARVAFNRWYESGENGDFDFLLSATDTSRYCFETTLSYFYSHLLPTASMLPSCTAAS